MKSGAWLESAEHISQWLLDAGRTLYDVLAAPLTHLNIKLQVNLKTSTPVVLPRIQLGKWPLDEKEVVGRVKNHLGSRLLTLRDPTCKCLLYTHELSNFKTVQAPTPTPPAFPQR